MHQKTNESRRWDTLAKQFDALQVPQWGKDPFLNILETLPVWENKPAVMDLGCGAGRYSVALAEKCTRVLGTDLSPNMIEYAEQKKAVFHLENVSFVCEDWAEVDPAERGYEKQFDLVFGHMTPALQDLETLQKMIDCSRGWCAMASHERRSTPMQQELNRYLGITDTYPKREKITEFFGFLYQRGMCPVVQYYDRDDSRSMAPEEAIEFFKNNLHGVDVITPEIEEKIRDFVWAQAIDGTVVHTVESKIVAMTWHV